MDKFDYTYKAINENGTQNTNPTIAVNGKLNLIDSAKNEDETLQGEGKVTSTTAEAIKVLGNGNFVLGTNESGTGAENVISIINPVVEGNTYGVAVEGNAKFEFYDGIISGKTNAINGIVAATPEYYEVVSNKENDYEVAILSQAATITFDKNADESVNITLEYETATKVIGQLIESLPTAQREGYVFVGWTLEEPELPSGYEKLEYIVEQGAKIVYVPIANQPDTITMPGDIWSKISILFYGSAEDLMRKVFELE